MKYAALFALATVVAACSASPTEPPPSTMSAALGGCDGDAFRRCLDGNGGGGCAKYCLSECRDEVAACVRGGGGAGCMSRCRDGDVTSGGGSSEFDTSTCSDPGRATTFMGWVHQDASEYTAGERLCWCKSWHKIKSVNGYSDDVTSRATQLLCYGSADGSIGLPNGDGDGEFPPGVAMAIYCQLNPAYSGCS